MHRYLRPSALPVLALLCLLPGRSTAFEFFDDRLQIHGSFQVTVRTLADSWEKKNWYFAQWSNVLNVELELDIAPDGWGPFDLVSGFARVELRYQCEYTGCGVLRTWRHFGDRATRAPAPNWADADNGGYSGPVRIDSPAGPIHDNEKRLLSFPSSPLLSGLADLGSTGIDRVFAPVADDEFLFKKISAEPASGSFILGPWRPESHIRPNGTLQFVENTTFGLPFRPAIPRKSKSQFGARGLYAPSYSLDQRLEGSVYDDHDQNLSQHNMELNQGAGQDEKQLKEIYLDIEMFDSRLWIRVGKQNIVWGKTELFRTTDQFNPVDIGLASLSSLEESRLALWSIRAVLSLYDLGPFQDVRIEAALNFDDFEPIDLGRCGEPYVVWLVCAKTFGLWAHGMFGLGLAGEKKPPDPWDHVKGLEGGVRVEWRWDRFSFAVVDFYGYSDGPYVDTFNRYSRAVDPETGRPLDVFGKALTAENALELHPGNRQFFDFVCGLTVGLGEALIAGLADRCLLDIVNSDLPLGFVAGDDITIALNNILAGDLLGVVFGALTGGAAAPPLAVLNIDPMDPPFLMVPLLLGFTALDGRLTDQQEALLGCGPFYDSGCDTDGIDLFNAEAGALFMAFPQVPEVSRAEMVTRRTSSGRVVVLPGARGPGDPGYDINVDGTPPPGFHSEMEAVSFNFMLLLGGLGAAGGADPECDLNDPITCSFVRAAFAIVGFNRPMLRAEGNKRFGRLDFLWHGGAELELKYNKRNVFGVSADFAEDITKTNWNVEFTWIKDEIFGSSEDLRGFEESDVYNLTISVDRPTFVNFLNSGRTLFFNSQWFIRYLPNYDGKHLGTNGPVSVLATFAVATGYFQDRLLPSLVFVHDFSSSSGGVIGAVTYRITESFSVNFGVASFYGGPERSAPGIPILPSSNPGSSRSNFQGLSAIAERDELFASVRTTF